MTAHDHLTRIAANRNGIVYRFLCQLLEEELTGQLNIDSSFDTVAIDKDLPAAR